MSARSGIRQKKSFPAPFGAIPGNFLHGPKTCKIASKYGCEPGAFHRHLAIFVQFSYFFGPRRKLPGMAPNGAGRFFFRLIQTLPTFWAERILILRIFIFCFFWDPKFPDFQVPDFQKSALGPGLGLGPGWAPRLWARGSLGWAGGPLGWAGGPLGSTTKQRNKNYQNEHPFCPKCLQGPDQ